MKHTFFAPTMGFMIQILKSYDLDPDPLLPECGIDPALITDPNARLPLARIAELYKKAAELIPDPNFGLKAEQYWHPTRLGALGYAWMTSDTLRAGCERLSRFSKIINYATDITLKESNKGLSVVLVLPK